MGGCDTIHRNVFVYQRTATTCNMVAGRDQVCRSAGRPKHRLRTCGRGPEHPLFILYTSGSTGKPKGVRHSTGGYLLWAKMTMDWTFDLRADDIFWCGRHWLDYRPHLRGLRPAGGRRHADHLRRHPHLPERRPLLADDQRHLHHLHTAPAIRSLIKASARPTGGAPRTLRPVEPAHPGQRGRPNPKPGCGTTRTWAAGVAPSWTPSGRPGPAARHHPIARRHTAGARQLHAALPGITAAIVDGMGNDVPNGSGGILVIKRPGPA